MPDTSAIADSFAPASAGGAAASVPARPDPGRIPAEPYPGLRPFDEADAQVFFGREDHIDSVLARLERRRFVAVVGASGGGKSSLVRAGVIPALRAGLFPGGASWQVITFRPGTGPMEAFAREIAKSAATTIADDVLQRLMPPSSNAEEVPDPLAFANSLPNWFPDQPNTNFLLVVDQFEEIFDYRDGGISARREADAFVQMILASVTQRRSAVYVVLTMRSDFLGHCMAFHGLPEVMNDTQYLTPQLRPDELRDTIVGPSRVFGFKLEPSLVDTLLDDVSSIADEADQLPLLQHGLLRLWYKAADQKSLKLSDYLGIVEVGDFATSALTTKRASTAPEAEPALAIKSANDNRLARVLDDHADEVYAALPDDLHRDVAECLFRTLSARNAGKVIRKPTTLPVLRIIVGGTLAGRGTADDINKALSEVLDAFHGSGRGFVTAVDDGQSIPIGMSIPNEATIDVPHEALLRRWNKLATWVDAEADNRALYERLAMDAAAEEQRKKYLRTYSWPWRIKQWTGKRSSSNRNPQSARALDVPPGAAPWTGATLVRGLEWRKKYHPTLAWAIRHDPAVLEDKQAEDTADARELRENATTFRDAMGFLDRSYRLRQIQRFAIGFASCSFVAFLIYFAARSHVDAQDAMANARTANYLRKKADESAALAITEKKEADFSAAKARASASLATASAAAAEKAEKVALEQTRLAVKSAKTAGKNFRLAEQMAHESHINATKATLAEAKAGKERALAIKSLLRISKVDGIRAAQLALDPRTAGGALATAISSVFPLVNNGTLPPREAFDGLSEAIDVNRSFFSYSEGTRQPMFSADSSTLVLFPEYVVNRDFFGGLNDLWGIFKFPVYESLPDIIDLSQAGSPPHTVALAQSFIQNNVHKVLSPPCWSFDFSPRANELLGFSPKDGLNSGQSTVPKPQMAPGSDAQSNIVAIWNARNGLLEYCDAPVDGAVLDARLADDGNRLLVAGENGFAILGRPHPAEGATWSVLRSVDTRKNQSSALSGIPDLTDWQANPNRIFLSPDGLSAIFFRVRGDYALESAASRSEPNPVGPPELSRYLTALTLEEPELWDVESGIRIAQLPNSRIAFSCDGSRLTCVVDSSVAHSRVKNPNYSNDSAYVGDGGCTVSEWNMRTWHERTVRLPHVPNETVIEARITPDRNRCVSISAVAATKENGMRAQNVLRSWTIHAVGPATGIGPPFTFASSNAFVFGNVARPLFAPDILDPFVGQDQRIFVTLNGRVCLFSARDGKIVAGPTDGSVRSSAAPSNTRVLISADQHQGDIIEWMDRATGALTRLDPDEAVAKDDVDGANIIANSGQFALVPTTGGAIRLCDLGHPGIAPLRVSTPAPGAQNKILANMMSQADDYFAISPDRRVMIGLFTSSSVGANALSTGFPNSFGTGDGSGVQAATNSADSAPSSTGTPSSDGTGDGSGEQSTMVLFAPAPPFKLSSPVAAGDEARIQSEVAKQRKRWALGLIKRIRPKDVAPSPRPKARRGLSPVPTR